MGSCLRSYDVVLGLVGYRTLVTPAKAGVHLSAMPQLVGLSSPRLAFAFPVVHEVFPVFGICLSLPVYHLANRQDSIAKKMAINLNIFLTYCIL